MTEITWTLTDPQYPAREIERHGDTITVELWYPRVGDQARYIEVGLVDVRAADNIRISYDFDRDGYVIEQASCFEGPDDDDDWQEVAFVQAWGRARPGTFDAN